MKCTLILFLLISIFHEDSHSQTKFNISGYFLELPNFQYSNPELANYYGSDKYQFLNLARLRIHPVLHLSKNLRIEVEYEMDALNYGPIESPGIELPDKTNRQLVKLKWKLADEAHFKLIHYIDRLYFRAGFKTGSVVIGRQRISWGTGRIWNPTDLFNPINPASYYKIEKDGADAISLKYAFGKFTDLNLVFNPQDTLYKSNYGFRLRTNFSEYDMSFMGGYFDRRIVGGLDFAGNLYKAGVRGEGIFSINKENPSDRFTKFILGIDNQFSPEFYGLLEYHYNGEGKTDKSSYDLARLAKGEIQNLSRNYICGSITYQLNPLVSLMLTNITNLNDKSGFVNLTGSYSALENLTLNIGSQITYGSIKSEYWYYPTSVYIIIQYYF